MDQGTRPSFDAGRAEAFAGRMLDVVNGGFLSLMASLGHQAGLFDVMAELPPATSPEIVEGDPLNAYYVCPV